MKDEIFRKTSLDRLSSPEQLNEYMKVVTPSVWLVLGAIIVILAATVIWCSFGTLDDKLQLIVASDGVGETSCFVPAGRKEDVSEGMVIIVDGEEYSLGPVSWMNLYSAAEIGRYLSAVGDYAEDKYFCCVPLNTVLPKGIYKGEVILEKISPIKFLLNVGAQNE